MILALLTALLVALGGSAWAGAEGLPCVICHPSRDRAAFDLLSGMPGVDVKGESGQAFVCYSCHNGSVTDSRLVLGRGAQHPSGFAPTRPLPKGFPLYAGARMECGTCHSPHGKGAGARRWLRGAGDGLSPCTACHAGQPESHVGVRLGAEMLRIVQARGGSVGEGGKMVCTTCHRVHGAPASKLLIVPYAAGREDLCRECHPAEGGKASEASPTHPCSSCHPVHRREPAGQQAGSRCDSCHAGRGERHLGKVLGTSAARGVQALGGRTGEGGRIVCASCHRVHGAEGAKLLVAGYGPKRDDLCRGCHPGISVKGQAIAQAPQPCSDCHTPHLETPLQLAGGERGPCARCHAQRAGAGEHPAASPACSDCHSVHRPFLPARGKGGLLRMPAVGAFLCQSCHDRVGKAHGPGSIAPADARPLLEARGIVTGPNGEFECTACHQLHGAKQGHLLRFSPLPLCLYCHPSENPFGVDGPKAGVHPVGVFLRRLQRSALSSAGGAVAPGNSLDCTSCHDAHAGSASFPACVECHTAEVAGESHGGVKGCRACHAVHGGVPPTQTCEKCHAAVQRGPHRAGMELSAAATQELPGQGPGGRLGLSGILGCSSCHDPHGVEPALLRKGTPSATCLACHRDKALQDGGPHDGARKPDQAACEPCHPAHGGSRAAGEDPLGALCRGCHGQDLKAAPDHGPLGRPTWKRVMGALPLFDRSGHRNPYGFVSCATCHDVHKGAGEGALREEARDPPRLCLRCHPEKESLLGTVHDPRRKAGGEVCGSCHPVHSRGELPPLWSLRSGAHGTWNDRMCSPCHGPPADGPQVRAGTRSHPVNVVLPREMRPAGLPLYDALGGKAGRSLACSTCHDIHGVSQGGGSTLPKFLRKNTTNGDLCAACHTAEAAVVGTPHDTSRKEGASPLGPCGPCHKAHGARTSERLWALEPAAGDYLPNTWCRSCHRQGGPVPGKQLLLQYHMKDAEALRTPRGTFYLQRPMALVDEWALKTAQDPPIALFSKQGVAGPEGNLQCLSCHDPHQWSPFGAFVKPGFGSLGPNVPTHFLRLRNPETANRSVCAVCHEADAVERYRKYHQVWEQLGEEFQ